ncbi:hypothetical protein ACSBOX_05990 [Arthrobacter sp. KN11-1C]|uniref:hypothetical protein n=1 Tax=Arthrobacter sp. KN11-1C TaxID=3445774 RepID=UPI003F9EDD31
MDDIGKRRVPKATAAEPTDRVLTPEQKRELTIDTMASWALDGLRPDRQTVEEINAFLQSGLSAGEYLLKLKEGVTPAEAPAKKSAEERLSSED